MELHPVVMSGAPRRPWRGKLSLAALRARRHLAVTGLALLVAAAGEAAEGSDRHTVHAVPALPDHGRRSRADDDDDTARWTRRLSDPDARARREAADRLGDRGRAAVRAVPALIEALDDPVGSVREEVVDALGDIGRGAESGVKREVLAALEKALTGDTHAGVRKDAAEKLEDIGKEADLDVVTGIVRALTKGLGDADGRVREESVDAIAMVLQASRRRVGYLRFRLEREAAGGDGGGDAAGGSEAHRRTLADLESAMAAASDALIPLYRREEGDDDREEIREAIIEALGELLGVLETPPSSLVTMLVEALGDRDGEVREEAVEVLREVDESSAGSASAALEAAVLEGLGVAFREGDVRRRRALVAALAALGARLAGVVSLLADLTKDADGEVRESAVDALGDIGRRSVRENAGLARSVITPLAEALRDAEDDVRREAADALGDLGELAEGAIPTLLASLEHPEGSTRENAIEALGRIGRAADSADPKLVTAFTQCLEDPDDEVREEAAEALGAMGPKAKSSADALRRATQDDDRGVRRAAERALRRVEEGGGTGR